MAHWLNKIGNSLQKECGLIKLKTDSEIDIQSQMAKSWQSNDSKMLMESATKLSDKIMIIGENIIKQKKFKQKAKQ